MGKRRYLTGLDWIIHALDSATRRVCSTGNHSQIVLELEGSLDPVSLGKALQEFISAFPLIKGRAARRWTLEPYWKIPADKKRPALRLEVLQPAEGKGFETLEKCLNTPFRNKREYITFYYLQPSGGCAYLAMAFDHKLLDARGAELFLELFNRHVEGGLAPESLTQASNPVQPSLLTQWGKRFESGRCMIRSTRPYMDAEIAGLADEEIKSDTRVIHLALDEAESGRFMEQANKKAGFLMFMPYALALAVQAFGILCRHKSRKGSIIVPCTTDLRGTDDPDQKIFFNYCSMLFFRADEPQLDNESQLIESFKTQFYDQCKAGFPEHFEKVMALMRIMPVRMFDWMMSTRMKHCFGSFSFASLGESAFGSDQFCSVRVRNLYHMPHIPPQVGIGFIFNTFQGRINVGLSYRENLLDQNARDHLATELKQLCLK